MSNYYNRQWRLPNAWNGTESNVNKQSNYSMDFDGSSYINAGNDSGLAISGNFTISLWVNQTTTTAFSYLLDKGGAGSNINYRGGINSSNQIYFQINGNSLTSTGTITNGTWSHIVLVKSGTSMNIYIDNNAETPATAPATAYTGTENLEIGRQTGGANYLNGKIDGVAIFDYALSSSQITTLYGSSSTGIGNPMSLSPKPVAYYPLGDQDAFNGADYLVPNSSLKDYVFDFVRTTISSGDNIDVSGYTGLNNASAFTVSVWFKGHSFTTDYIFSTSIATDYANNAIGLYLSSNQLKTNVYFGGVNSGISNVSIDLNKWYHAAITFDGSTGTATTYVNATAYVGSGNLGTTSPNFDTNLMISGLEYAAGSTAYYFDGEISNFQVFNTALSATGSNSIETLYNNGSPLTSMSGFTSLQGWWKLDASATYDSSTTTWTIPDDSTNSNDGTSSGMTQANLVQSDLSFTSGYSPYALNFDQASGQYINTTFNPSTEIGDNASFTISGWIRPTDVDSFMIFMGSFGGSKRFFLGVNTSGGAIEYGYGGANLSLSADINVNIWQNIILVYDNSAGYFYGYVNGQLIGSYNFTFSATISTANIRIGTAANLSLPYGGDISNLSIWNAALTSSQVLEIYNEGVPSNLNNHSSYSNLLSWWQLGSNSSWVNPDWTVLDEKGSNNGTSSNMGEDAIVDGVGSYANGLSSGMGGDEVIGDAPYSTANSLSVNMDVEDRVSDTPS